MENFQKTFILSNSYKIPGIGFGTMELSDIESIIEDALKAGYRHIDTAAIYKNEVEIGNVLRNTDIPRNELFITSKLWNTERGYKRAINAFESTLKNLQTDYLDLYLIHWPASKSQFSNWDEINRETWRALIDLYKIGKIRAIGVSNFLPHHLKSLLSSEIAPMVNQIEYHPGTTQDETVRFCRENNILIEAWSPLGTGKVLKDKRLEEISVKYNKSVAQITLRWCIQNNVLPLPKSSSLKRMAENLDVFDFVITKEDMNEIDLMKHFDNSGLHPDSVTI